MASLADQIRSLTNPEPSRFDLDEDEFDVTRAKVVDKEKDLEDIKNESIPNAGALRKKTIRLLQDEDKKYAGRKITRAQLQSSREYAVGSNGEEESNSDVEDDVQNGKEVSRGDGDDDIDDDNDDEDNDEDNDLGNDFSDEEDSIGSEDIQGNEVHDLSTESSEDDANYDDDGDENINDIDDDDDDDVVENDEGADDNGIQSFSAASLAEDIEKGKAAKNQLSLWDSFLEMRIRLQKALIVANKLPQPEQMTEFSSCGGKNLKEVYKQGRKSVAKLLGNLLLIQESLLEQNADTSNILNPGTDNKTTARSSDDEEIPSDTEDETSDGGVDNGEGHVNKEQAKHSLKLPVKRKHDMSTDEYAEYISKRHAAFKTYRDATIAKWSEKTRLATGKINSKSFSSFDRSALAQINHILSDKDRLIKRTQMKRSSYRVLGKSEEDEKQNVLSSEEQADMHLRDFDPEIFDDDDFYHQLLREFIEQKTSGTTGQPIELGRQWLELQKLRKKVKRKIDTKASKGRKVRYQVHGKLVSFMAPIEKGHMPHSSRYIDVFQNVDYLCAVAKDILEKRQKQGFPGTKDLVQLMLKAHEEHVDGVSKLSDDEIMAQSIVFLMAGFETTGNTLTSIVYFLAKYPEVQDRLIREIDELINTHRDEPLYELVQKDGYMDQVISEVLRLCGPALLLIRECSKDAIYKGIRIPKGCGINIPVYVLHRDPDLWDNPLDFNPENFSPEAKEKRDSFAFLPFGAGPRQCIGMRLALLEIKIAIMKITQRFKFERAPETVEKLEHRAALLLSPKETIYVKLRAR